MEETEHDTSVWVAVNIPTQSSMNNSVKQNHRQKPEASLNEFHWKPFLPILLAGLYSGLCNLDTTTVTDRNK